MKHIRRPAPVVLGASLELSFDQFVEHLVNTDERFNASGPGIRAGIRVEDGLRVNDDFVVLNEDAWRMLRDAAEQPSAGYPTLIAPNGAQVLIGRKLLPFIDAIANASDG